MSAPRPGERILVVEDEPDILEVIEYNLRRAGYRVEGVQDGAVGLSRACEVFPDLVLLDLMLPGLDGLSLCRRLKADPDMRSIPVVMVTAKGELDDVVAGLEAGADDYITKPFRPQELLARIRAVLRRGTWDDPRERERIVVGDLTIDAARHEAWLDGELVPFTATEFRLLHYLAANRGRVFSRDHLLDRVFGGGSAVVDRNVDVHVGTVRKKLGPHRDLIETVRGVGYRLRDG